MAERILFLDHVGVCGGAELSLLDLARAHRPYAKVALLADGPFRERLTAAGVPVEVIHAGKTLTAVRQGSGLMRGLRATPDVLRLVARVTRLAREADLVYANSQKAFVVAALAGAAARRPVVWALRDILTAEMFGRTNRRVVVTLANRFAARVLANSHATAEAFVHVGGRRDRVRVVHNGIDPAPYQNIAPPSDLLPGQGLFRIGVFGRLAPWKGQHVLLDALTRVPGVHVLIVGDALFGETDYRDRLHAQVQRSGIADRVSFLGFRNDVPALMHAVDAVVHCSVEPEPFGRVIVEGMFAGRPVIATDAGGVKEIIDRPGELGLLVPPNDAQALAAAIRQLRDQPAEAQAMAQRGRAHALVSFTVQRMIEAFNREMRSLMADRGRRPASPAAKVDSSAHVGT